MEKVDTNTKPSGEDFSSPSKNVFITGIGSGLGKALAEKFINEGYTVFAISRHLPKSLEGKINFIQCDLRALEEVKDKTKQLLSNVSHIEYVILNAGILGDIKEIHKTKLYEIQQVMDVNVWSNKVILDAIIDLGIDVNQIIGISSGAAVNGNKGWGAYSISKAALNMLLKLYSREIKAHVIALAPGLITTPMLNYILENVDDEKFPSVKRLKASPKMTPEEAAEKLFNLLPKLKQFESGSFIDVRKI